MIDLKKPLQTRDGREVKIFMENGGSKNWPILGAHKEDNIWSQTCWNPNGLYYYEQETANDLINVPEKPKEEILINPLTTFRCLYCGSGNVGQRVTCRGGMLSCEVFCPTCEQNGEKKF